MLKYFKVCIALPKEVLIHQADVNMALFILKSGSLQAAAVEQTFASTGRSTDGNDKGPKTRQTKLNRQSTSWKQKLQVKMIEVPGSLICCYNPYTPPKPLPFSITSLSKSLLVFMNLSDLLHVFNLCSAEQVAPAQALFLAVCCPSAPTDCFLSLRSHRPRRTTRCVRVPRCSAAHVAEAAPLTPPLFARRSATSLRSCRMSTPASPPRCSAGRTGVQCARRRAAARREGGSCRA